MKFDALWRLMFWFNQMLAALVLWGITIYLLKNKKPYIISLIPALFMTAVVFTYLFIAKEALGMEKNISFIIGLGITAVSLIWFSVFAINYNKKNSFEV
jgi:carbon starvation protein CstA